MYRKHLSQLPLKEARELRSYSGDKLDLLGELTVTVEYHAHKYELPLVIVKGDKPALLGRNWLEIIKLDWGKILSVSKDNPVDRLEKEYPKLFDVGYGKINNFKATISLQPGSQPVYRKTRPVPYALKQKVEAELNRLEQQGIIKKVERSNWAAPIVVVPKTDKSIRICGDYKVSINPYVRTEGYPLPTVQDLFSSVSNGAVFSKPDLQHAYQQLEVEESSQPLLTINTHKGLYQYLRLPFGISSAPSIFQAVMDQILKGQKNTICYLDDILVMGKNAEEHMEALEGVLKCLQDHRMKLRLDKCKFLQTSVEYLGHRIDENGLHPTTEKVNALVKAPRSKNVMELKSYLGLLNYYGHFLSNLSTTVQPLNELLCKGKKWIWSAECEKAFEQGKQALVNSQALVHYDPTKPITLACDTSPYGVGAVISHVELNGQERPVAFASRSLTKAERDYAQIEREALAIIFGVRKSHQYLYGRMFTLQTDHKPLMTIMGSKTGIPTLAAARMQRWAVILSAYQYKIEYRQSSKNANADAMSRLPVGEAIPECDSGVFLCSFLEEIPIGARDIREATKVDYIVSLVLMYTLEDWPGCLDQTQHELRPYFNQKEHLSVEQGCILLGYRVIIPVKYRGRLLNELHTDHPGICKMKALARCYLWWPNKKYLGRKYL